MATRSSIAMVVPEGIRSIYCHHDGYPEGVGAMLSQHYTDPAKITQLLDLGDISYLSEDVGVWKQDFNDPIPGITLAYGRDRGESDTEAMIHSDEEEWENYRKGSVCEYGYLWDGDAWTLSDWGIDL
jgi:hypothetical protein